PAQPARGPLPARGGLPRLPADRRDVVRAAQRLPGPRLGGPDRRGPGGRVLPTRGGLMDALDALTDADLTAVGAALRSGRLQAPFTGVSVQRYCSAAHAAAVAGGLQQLHDEGMPPRHLALLAESIVRTRTPHQQADLVDLVWTGPETLGVTNRD